jgi:hypothetical protein
MATILLPAHTGPDGSLAKTALETHPAGMSLVAKSRWEWWPQQGRPAIAREIVVRIGDAVRGQRPLWPLEIAEQP